MRDFVVECRPEPCRGLIPVRFGQPGQMHLVADVLDRWDGDDHRYFRVCTEDGAVYILRQDLRDDRWWIQFYQRAS